MDSFSIIDTWTAGTAPGETMIGAAGYILTPTNNPGSNISKWAPSPFVGRR